MMRRVARSPWVGALAAVAVTTVVAILVLSEDVEPVSEPGVATVRIDTSGLGPSVPASYLGLSLEWDSVTRYTGPAGRRRTALLDVLEPLRRAARSPLALRIGGDSGDQAWWNPGGKNTRPPTVQQDIGPRTLDAIGWLARGLGGPVSLGLNLALQDPGNALALARAARAQLPAGQPAALELGNEPDLYTHVQQFRRGGHLHVRVRKHNRYRAQNYMRDAQRYVDVLSDGLQPTPPRLVVGGFAGATFQPALPELLERTVSRADVVAGHLYALPNCDAPTPPLPWLSMPEASRQRAMSMKPLTRVAAAHHAETWVTELNSAACGGRPAWSATPTAALWLTDMLFALLEEGVTRAEVHTWRGALYAPFAVVGESARVRPRAPLRGMLAFARAAPSGSRLARAQVEGRSSLRAWATVDRDGSVRVALVAPEPVTARVPATSTNCASLWRTFPRGISGGPRCPRGGDYVVGLHASSVAVLTIPQ